MVPSFPAIRRASLLLMLALAAATPARAQRLDSLAVGVRVRVTRHSPSRPLVGTFVGADSTGVVLSPARGGPPVFTPLADLQRVDVSRGARTASNAFWRGAGIGFLVGAGIGVAATGLALHHDLHSTSEGMVPTSVVVGALGIGLTGVTTIVGGGIGVATRERWRRAWPAR